MNAEVRLMLELDEYAWSITRERERINRGKVCVLVGPGGRVVCAHSRSTTSGQLRSTTTTLEPVTATMVGVCRYEAEDSAGAAAALSIVAGKKVVAIDVYEFAKARQYCARRTLQQQGAS